MNVSLKRSLVVLFLAFLGFSATEKPASAQAWSLTTAQRTAYLNYYAPVILKRGDEDEGKRGQDWITNYDFDQDGNFSNNRVNWLNINQYVAASAYGPSGYDHWRIRPTLYTALIEYMEGSSKSLVLLYHVYHAADKSGSDIHDWERVEIVVHGVSGTPGATAGEYVNHVTVTHHFDQIMRRSYDSGLNFMQTPTGKHVLVWQADGRNVFSCDTYGHELRLVNNPYYGWIGSQQSSLYATAEVNVSGKDEKKNVHYVFVPEGSPAAVDMWSAMPLNYAAAAALASGFDHSDTVGWSQVKRITYELQDLADIIPTHWQYNPWQLHWLASESEDILLESPILNEAGQLEVSAGLQRFYTKAYDVASSDTDVGILEKKWFSGGYSAELDEDCPSTWFRDDFKAFEGLGTDSYGLSRGAASGYYNSHNSYWWQHDFFVHSGAIDGAETREAGRWLPGGWYTAANGGFDGRWVQLFDDRPGYEPVMPLALTLNHEPYKLSCSSVNRLVTAKANGGTPPYTFIWSNGAPTTTSSSISQAQVAINTTVTVTVWDAAGGTRSSSRYIDATCNEGDPR